MFYLLIIQIGNKDTSRVSTRFNEDVEMINIMSMLVLTLPGTAISYYGEEIGMHDLSDTQALKAEKFRSPMQWTPGPMAGFTEGNATWLPLPGDADVNNVKVW
jgi:neutral and basic amino acid transporter 1